VIKTIIVTLEKEKTQNESQNGKEEMKAVAKLIAIAVATVVVMAMSKAVAQRKYDPKTVETIQGKVLSVEKTAPAKNRGYGVHLMLQTDKETIAVHLGPAWYIDKQTPHIETNDTVTVTGSRVTVDGKPAIVAAQIKKGDDVLKLRDDNGIPVWRGAARGNR
jgi:hypothetical protein